jgi:hypothetical protein
MIALAGNGAAGKQAGGTDHRFAVDLTGYETAQLSLLKVSSKGHRTIGGGGSGRAIRNDYFPDEMITVPIEDYPPPGLCRVWYPDRSPFIQPPISDCGVAVPRGAILIIG